MPDRPIELILERRLASYLAAPMFVIDTSGTLVYYNEALAVWRRLAGEEGFEPSIP
jgi:hypothetical protein